MRMFLNLNQVVGVLRVHALKDTFNFTLFFTLGWSLEPNHPQWFLSLLHTKLTKWSGPCYIAIHFLCILVHASGSALKSMAS